IIGVQDALDRYPRVVDQDVFDGLIDRVLLPLGQRERVGPADTAPDLLAADELRVAVAPVRALAGEWIKSRHPVPHRCRSRACPAAWHSRSRSWPCWRCAARPRAADPSSSGMPPAWRGRCPCAP